MTQYESGRIDLNELTELYKMIQNQNSETVYSNMFNYFDKNKDGKLGREEFQSLGKSISKTFWHRCIRRTPFNT